ncbi:hypothetical protein FDUTEX481_08941 [Tolypothrix sp. PCC 7601]|nr:hypothetical protein FDUTEX481_08941 [Tolypothrix sp. PCC 7601]
MMSDWLRQQSLSEARIPMPSGWGVCQDLLPSINYQPQTF